MGEAFSFPPLVDFVNARRCWTNTSTDSLTVCCWEGSARLKAHFNGWTWVGQRLPGMLFHTLTDRLFKLAFLLILTDGNIEGGFNNCFRQWKGQSTNRLCVATSGGKEGGGSKLGNGDFLQHSTLKECYNAI